MLGAAPRDREKIRKRARERMMAMQSQEELLEELSRCVLEMEDEEIVPIAQEYAQAGYDPAQGILKGLVSGMNEAAKLYEEGEYYVPELLMCSSAMYNALDVLKPLIPKEAANSKGRIVIGVVEGDTHDIGKNLVKVMLEAAGYEIIDLGRDVPVDRFVQTACDQDAQVIALATLMTTSMDNMRRVVDLLKQDGVRDRFKVIIGGGPVSPAYAQRIGADAYASDAMDAVHVVNKLLGYEQSDQNQDQSQHQQAPCAGAA